jgi:hypothetical protein
MVIVRPFQFHVSDLVRRCLTARLADPPLVSILNYLHHPFSLDRRASALPKSKASQRNEPNYQFFYMSYYAAAHLLELKPIDDLDLKSRKKARQIARRKQHTCVVCGHAITFTDERQGPEIIVVAKPFDRGDYLGGAICGKCAPGEDLSIITTTRQRARILEGMRKERSRNKAPSPVDDAGSAP